MQNFKIQRFWCSRGYLGLIVVIDVWDFCINVMNHLDLSGISLTRWDKNRHSQLFLSGKWTTSQYVLPLRYRINYRQISPIHIVPHEAGILDSTTSRTICVSHVQLSIGLKLVWLVCFIEKHTITCIRWGMREGDETIIIQPHDHFPTFGITFSSKEKWEHCKYFISYLEDFYVIKTKFRTDFCT